MTTPSTTDISLHDRGGEGAQTDDGMAAWRDAIARVMRDEAEPPLARFGEGDLCEPVEVLLPDGKPGRVSMAGAWLWQELAREACGRQIEPGVTRGGARMEQFLEHLSERSPAWDRGIPSLRGLWLLRAAARDFKAMTWSPSAWLRAQKGVYETTAQTAVRALAEAYTRCTPGLAPEKELAGWNARVRRGVFHQIEPFCGEPSRLSGVPQWRVDALLALPGLTGEEDTSVAQRLVPRVCGDIAQGAVPGNPKAFAQAVVRYLDATRGAVAASVLEVLAAQATVAAPEGLRAFGVRSAARVRQWTRHGWGAAQGRLERHCLRAIYEAQVRHDGGQGGRMASAGCQPMQGSLHDLHAEASGALAAGLVEGVARLMDARWLPRDEAPAARMLAGLKGSRSGNVSSFRAVGELLLCCGRAGEDGASVSGAGKAALRRVLACWMREPGGYTLLAGAWLQWLEFDSAAHPARALAGFGIRLDMTRMFEALQHPGCGANDRKRTLAQRSDDNFRLEAGTDGVPAAMRARRRA